MFLHGVNTQSKTPLYCKFKVNKYNRITFLFQMSVIDIKNTPEKNEGNTCREIALTAIPILSVLN